MVIHMFRNFCQQVYKIIMMFQVVCFFGFCKTVDDGIGISSCHCVNHFPVLLDDSESPYCLLCGIVIHRNLTIFQKYSQISLVVDGVVNIKYGSIWLNSFENSRFCTYDDISDNEIFKHPLKQSEIIRRKVNFAKKAGITP